jgi:hypothetical protein
MDLNDTSLRVNGPTVHFIFLSEIKFVRQTNLAHVLIILQKTYYLSVHANGNAIVARDKDCCLLRQDAEQL